MLDRPSSPSEIQTEITKLHKYLSDVSKGQLDGLGVQSNQSALARGWESIAYSPAALRSHKANFNATITDAAGLNNEQERRDVIENLLERGKDAGYIPSDAYQNRIDKLNANDISGGKVSALGISTITDILKNSDSIPSSLKSEFSSVLADAIANDKNSVSTDSVDKTMSSIESWADKVTDLMKSGRMPESLRDLSTATRDAISANGTNMVTGMGGGLIGDAAEFLNAAYNSIKSGISTGNWAPFHQNVADFGVSAVVSAALAGGTIAAAGVLAGSAAATAVAAAWAAYGLYDAVKNGAELLSKLMADWRDGTLADLLKKLFDTPPISPLVLDLDGDGIELIALSDSTAVFDLNADGFAEVTGWVSPDDALVAIDINSNGTIDNASELFGDQTGFRHGFLALAAHDGNNDKTIDAQDTVFPKLLLWQDLNGDGISQASELATLEEKGISSISVAPVGLKYQIAGHDVLWEAEAKRSNGAGSTVSDVYFQFDPVRTATVVSEDFKYDPEVFKLPILQGIGRIPSTLVVLSQNKSMKSQAIELLEQLSKGNITGFITKFEFFI